MRCRRRTDRISLSTGGSLADVGIELQSRKLATHCFSCAVYGFDPHRLTKIASSEMMLLAHTDGLKTIGTGYLQRLNRAFSLGMPVVGA